MVERGWMAAFDSPEFWNPKVRGAECLNRQAARSILPIADLRTRMVMAGHSKPEIVSAVKAAFDNKQLPGLENGAMAFMMSKSAYLYDEGASRGGSRSTRRPSLIYKKCFFRQPLLVPRPRDRSILQCLGALFVRMLSSASSTSRGSVSLQSH